MNIRSKVFFFRFHLQVSNKFWNESKDVCWCEFNTILLRYYLQLAQKNFIQLKYLNIVFRWKSYSQPVSLGLMSEFKARLFMPRVRCTCQYSKWKKLLCLLMVAANLLLFKLTTIWLDIYLDQKLYQSAGLSLFQLTSKIRKFGFRTF